MKTRFFLAALALGGGLLFAQALPASADSADDSIRDYRVDAVVASDGTTKVQLSVDFDFGEDSGHGMYLSFPLRQEIANDPDHWRMLDMKIQSVTSPTGANTELQTQEEDGNLMVRLGSEYESFTGTQTYVVDYTIRGLIAPKHQESGLDEFNWNVIGPAWEVPIRSADVSVTGPVAVTKVACYQGYGFDEPCTAAQEGDTATFQAQRMGNGAGMQVVAGFPAGTFVGAEARLEERMTFEKMFALTPWTVGLTGALTALGLFGVSNRTRRGKRDQVYLGFTPGVIPAADQGATVGYDSQSYPVAVRFEPPQGTRPGEVGTIIDSSADTKDVTSTVLDLAVRGYMQITQSGKKEWTFTRTADDQGLVGYESTLMNRMFSKGNQVTTKQLRNQSYAGMLTKTSEQLHRRVATELGWYTKNPSSVRALAVVAGIALGALGVFMSFVGMGFGWGIIGLAGIITGLAVLVRSNKFSHRTALGSAILAQTKGFQLYLTTAEAEQIKFEEGIDVFSRYLPYATVFGVADRWTKVFEQLAAAGRYEFVTPWYVGYGYGSGFSADSFSSAMSQLTSSMSSSMQASTAATSGSSGFSGGGGGFGGGGGGGW